MGVQGCMQCSAPPFPFSVLTYAFQTCDWSGFDEFAPMADLISDWTVHRSVCSSRMDGGVLGVGR